MKSLSQDISEILTSARQKTAVAINSAMVEAYWLVGQRIVEEEQGGDEVAGYGQYLLKDLSKELTLELGKGFSYSNLRNFRQFYLTYPDLEICYALRSKLSWTNHRLIMRLETEAEREYYLKEASQQQWSSRVLQRQIHTNTYQRLLSTQKTSDEETLDISDKPHINDLIKDPYVLEFLTIPPDPSLSENGIETAIINQLQKFLLELGNGFSFVSRQMRISTETSHFYIDLVFYNYLLKCFVIIDLKTTKLSHQDIGQIDMYVRMFDDLKRGEDDNPTIGLILCADKDETIVQYSVLKENEKLFASKYKMILPSEEDLKLELERERHRIKQQTN